jgi:hypothetical protein
MTITNWTPISKELPEVYTHNKTFGYEYSDGQRRSEPVLVCGPSFIPNSPTEMAIMTFVKDDDGYHYWVFEGGSKNFEPKCWVAVDLPKQFSE